MTRSQQVQATVVARQLDGLWRGVALTGPSGRGKSSLALQLMHRGWSLVADDAALIWQSGEALWAKAPPMIAGRVEVRGLGLMTVPFREVCQLDLIVALTDEEPERLPESVDTVWAGIAIRSIEVKAHSNVTPEVVSLALVEAVRHPITP